MNKIYSPPLLLNIKIKCLKISNNTTMLISRDFPLLCHDLNRVPCPFRFNPISGFVDCRHPERDHQDISIIPNDCPLADYKKEVKMSLREDLKQYFVNENVPVGDCWWLKDTITFLEAREDKLISKTKEFLSVRTRDIIYATKPVPEQGITAVMVTKGVVDYVISYQDGVEIGCKKYYYDKNGMNIA